MIDDRHLCRGIDKDKETWLFGYHVKINNVDYIIPTYASAFYGIEVDPDTVGRCTGLPDKNGTKIFEGDIIQYPNPNFGYGDPSTPEYFVEPVPMIPRLYGCDKVYCGYFQYHDGYTCEVIGTIHDKEGE